MHKASIAPQFGTTPVNSPGIRSKFGMGWVLLAHSVIEKLASNQTQAGHLTKSSPANPTLESSLSLPNFGPSSAWPGQQNQKSNRADHAQFAPLGLNMTKNKI